VAGGRVFTLGTTGKLTAYDAAGGKPLWAKDFSKDVDMSKLFCGTAASPIIANGRLIVQVGSDVRGGLVTALDPATGATAWEWRGPGPGYASPIVISPAAGVTQLVTLTNQSVIGLDPRGGRELWSIPFPDEWHENIVTPVWTGTALVVSGIRQGTRAFRLSAKGEAWSASEIWKNADVTMYMSTPVVGDGLVYGLSAKRKGQFVALDLETGATKWATEGREGEQAAVLLAPRHVLFLNNTGTLIVANRSAAKFETARRYELVDGATWTTPVFMNGAVFLRDATNLFRFDPK
jgi:outer membrane protein assembly factor BamB